VGRTFERTAENAQPPHPLSNARVYGLFRSDSRSAAYFRTTGLPRLRTVRSRRSNRSVRLCTNGGRTVILFLLFPFTAVRFSRRIPIHTPVSVSVGSRSGQDATVTAVVRTNVGPRSARPFRNFASTLAICHRRCYDYCRFWWSRTYFGKRDKSRDYKNRLPGRSYGYENVNELGARNISTQIEAFNGGIIKRPYRRP